MGSSPTKLKSLVYARVVELADTWDLKSHEAAPRTGSSPVTGTKSCSSINEVTSESSGRPTAKIRENLVGFSTPNNCGYITEGQGGILKCYICGIDVQRLACQPSKLDVGVRIPYSAPEARIGSAACD